MILYVLKLTIAMLGYWFDLGWNAQKGEYSFCEGLFCLGRKAAANHCRPSWLPILQFWLAAIYPYYMANVLFPRNPYKISA